MVSKSPYLALFPFQVAFSWLIPGGLLTIYKSWDDPPSTPQLGIFQWWPPQKMLRAHCCMWCVFHAATYTSKSSGAFNRTTVFVDGLEVALLRRQVLFATMMYNSCTFPVGSASKAAQHMPTPLNPIWISLDIQHMVIFSSTVTIYLFQTIIFLIIVQCSNSRVSVSFRFFLPCAICQPARTGHEVPWVTWSQRLNLLKMKPKYATGLYEPRKNPFWLINPPDFQFCCNNPWSKTTFFPQTNVKMSVLSLHNWPSPALWKNQDLDISS